MLRSQDDLREYRCWQVLLDGQHCVTEFGPSILQAVEVGAQQQHEHLVSYERTTKALYPLVSFEGRWMLDISTTAHGSGSGSDAQVQRLREMEHIRKSCVPHVCFQLMHFLQAFGDHHRWYVRYPRCSLRLWFCIACSPTHLFPPPPSPPCGHANLLMLMDDCTRAAWT